MRGSLVFGMGMMVGNMAWALEPVPSPPAASSQRGLTPVQREAVQQADRETAKAWEAQLSDAQREARKVAQRAIHDRERGEPGLPGAGADYDWRAKADQLGFSAADQARLERDKLFIEDLQLKQSFEGYTSPRGPVFVTSDVVLNAFNVLFEEGFRALEFRRAGDLRDELEIVLERCREQLADERNAFTMDELRSGWALAQRMVGPALRLLGTDAALFDEDLRSDIEREVGLIRTATTVGLPDWLGPPTPEWLGIDYRRMQPVGFYAENGRLADYFRAVRWLQSVPLRADRDDELTAIALLGDMADFNGGKVLGAYHDLLGRPDGRGLAQAADEFQNVLNSLGNTAPSWPRKLTDMRLWLLRDSMDRTERARLRDALTLPPAVAGALEAMEFRVLPAYRLPDSLALQGIGQPGRLPRGMIVAAMVGSDFARDRLTDLDAGKVAEALTAAREDWHPVWKRGAARIRPSLYDDYLDVLATLAAPADADAPGFMRAEAWAAKSCQTILAGWAQMRHTTNLQAKNAANYFGMMQLPPGFVEPNPTFFRCFANVVTRAKQSLVDAGAFEPSSTVRADELRASAATLEAFGFHLSSATMEDAAALPKDARMRYRQLMQAANEGMDSDESGTHFVDDDASFRRVHASLIERLRARADDYESGRRAPQSRGELRDRWDSLEGLSRRLEAMVHKQLRQQDWSPDEEDFLRDFGENIAAVMGYAGNSWFKPNDDAPRWATVASDPASDTLLAVAVGRPRPIHVLYPWRGHEVLCHGAVMSYYEYAARERLTDGAWRERLDSQDAPALPAWIEPILAR